MGYYEEAFEAIKNMFNDKSVSKETTKSNLQSLREEIEIMEDSLV